MDTDYEVVVIGGGAAGLGTAIALARSRRSVLVVDAGEPRNAAADGVHNFLTREGTSPSELLELGRQELRGYGGEVREATATSVVREEDGFVVTLRDRGRVSTRRVVVTTGLVDELPDVAGVRERWGHDVLHCPYCHGWEVRDETIGVLASSAMSVHQALMFRQLSDDVTFLVNGFELDDESRHQLETAGIALVEGAVTAIELTDDAISGVRLSGGRLVRRPGSRDRPADGGAQRGAHLPRRRDPRAPDGRRRPGRGRRDGPDHGARRVRRGQRRRHLRPGDGAAAAGTRVGAAVNIDLIMSDLRA